MVSPEILPDKKVTFRFRAPKAGEVLLNGNWDSGRDIQMTKVTDQMPASSWGFITFTPSTLKKYPQSCSPSETFFKEISTTRPEDWLPGTVEAIATASADGRRIVIKAVNYGAEWNALVVRLQGASVPEKALARLHTISAGLKDSASLEHPDAIAAVTRTLNYAKDLTVDLDPYTVAVVEIRAE